MRQNFIADNIVKLAIPSGEMSTLNLNPSGSLSPLNGGSGVGINSSRSAFNIPIDISADSIFSFDIKVNSQSVGASGVGMIAVVTYASTSPSVDISLNNLPSAVFSGLIVGDTITSQGRCIIPKLSLGDGQIQYVAIGFVDGTNAAISSSLRMLQCRVHTEDIQVFDPLRS